MNSKCVGIKLRHCDPVWSSPGLLQSSGPEWVEQRRFALRQLRDLGFGKSSMEDNILDEIEKLTNLLAKVSCTFSFYPFQLLKSEQYFIIVFMYLQ